MHGFVEQCRGALDGVHGEQFVFVGLIADAEILDDAEGFALHHNLVEHHRAAPHAPAGREFAVEECHTQTGFGHVVGRHDARRPAADDGHIEFKITVQFLEIGTDDTS